MLAFSSPGPNGLRPKGGGECYEKREPVSAVPRAHHLADRTVRVGQRGRLGRGDDRYQRHQERRRHGAEAPQQRSYQPEDHQRRRERGEAPEQRRYQPEDRARRRERGEAPEQRRYQPEDRARCREHGEAPEQRRERGEDPGQRGQRSEDRLWRGGYRRAGRSRYEDGQHLGASKLSQAGEQEL